MDRYLVAHEALNEVALSPGGHVVLLTSDPFASLGLRRLGLEVRDTLLILEPSGSRFAFLTRRPCEGTVAENVLRYGTGGLWIDGCRVGADTVTVRATKTGESCYGQVVQTNADKCATTTHAGRWPTNLVLIHGAECKLAGTKKVRTGMAFEPKAGKSRPHNVYGDSQYKGRAMGYADADRTETVAAWDCQEGCPVAAIDRQSGILKSGALRADSYTGSARNNNSIFAGAGTFSRAGYEADTGGASRIFPQFANTQEFMAWVTRLLGGPHD